MYGVLRSESKVGIYPTDPPAAARYVVVRQGVNAPASFRGNQLCFFCLTTRHDMWLMACLVG